MIDVPDHSLIIEPRDLPSVKSESRAVNEALSNPIGTPPLKSMVQPNDKVAIVISDITRPTPNHILVPEIIEVLNHVPLKNFVIINGTGTHRRSEEHTSELQSRFDLVCRLL